MDYTAEYRRKLTAPSGAVSAIANGSALVVAFGPAAPPALLEALAARARAGDLRDVHSYYMYAAQVLADTLLAPDVAPALGPRALFESGVDRGALAAERAAGVAELDYVPNYFSQIPRLLQDYVQPATFLAMVSPMDSHGYFSLGTCVDYGSTAAQCAERVIVEVNPRMPRTFGEASVHISRVAAIVEHEVPLLEVPPRAPHPDDETIGRLIAAEVPDGATIQLGIGGIPDAVAALLVNHKDLGIHSELFGNGMVDLIERGVVTGARKTLHRYQSLFTNAMGTRRLYDLLDGNPAIVGYPVSYTNDPYIVAQNDDFISINSIIEVDLTGQCNAESLEGAQYSGTGGQLDFVRGAYLSRGGKSFLAFHSTARDGTASRVVSQLGAGAVVTTPRMDTHYLVTEHGLVNLKGRSARERALAIIGLAHPKFRDDLLRAAQTLHLV